MAASVFCVTRIACCGACGRICVNHLYSLYDALVSIDVPSDKARAVVDAMERDMTTLLASKHDVAEMRLQTDSRFMQLDQKIEMLRLSVTKDIEALRAAMTIRLGSMLFIGLGLLFAALKLT